MIKAIIFILIIVCGYFIPFKRLYSFLVLVSLVILNYISPNVADVAAYEGVYNFIGNEGNQYLNTGYGWWLLCKIGNKLQLNYLSFKTVILIFSFSLVLYSLKRLNIKNNMLIATYLIYPAITDLIQIRFFLGTSIVIYLLTFLIKANFRSYIIYIGGIVLITSQIHTGTYFYLLLALWQVFFKYKEILYVLSIIGGIILTIDKRLIVLLVTYFGTDQESNFYLNTGYYASAKLKILFIVTTLLFLFFSYYIYKTINKKELEMWEMNYLKLTVFGNYISIFLIILSAFAFTFLRLQKPMWILNYIQIAIYTKYGTKGRLSPQVLWIVYGLLAAIWLIGTEEIALKDFF